MKGLFKDIFTIVWLCITYVAIYMNISLLISDTIFEGKSMYITNTICSIIVFACVYYECTISMNKK